MRYMKMQSTNKSKTINDRINDIVSCLKLVMEDSRTEQFYIFDTDKYSNRMQIYIKQETKAKTFKNWCLQKLENFFFFTCSDAM